MPELPEVETMRRGIRPIVGSRIRGVARITSHLKRLKVRPGMAAFRRRAVGRTVSSVGRVGERVILHLDSSDAIVLEPRMTGLVLLADPPDVAVRRLIAPEVVFAGDRVPLGVKLESNGYAGQRVGLRLAVDGRNVLEREAVLTGGVQF